MIRNGHLEFEILEDPGNRIAARFGLVFSLPENLRPIYTGFGIDLPRVNGDETWTLPIPARYVIGTDGIILSVDADPDYTVRTEPEETIRIVKNNRS